MMPISRLQQWLNKNLRTCGQAVAPVHYIARDEERLSATHQNDLENMAIESTLRKIVMFSLDASPAAAHPRKNIATVSKLHVDSPFGSEPQEGMLIVDWNGGCYHVTICWPIALLRTRNSSQRPTVAILRIWQQRALRGRLRYLEMAAALRDMQLR
jgi:hypothetical protein